MLLGGTGRAVEPPPDADLLEFLGSVDSEDSGWADYLEKTDVGQAARKHAPARDPGVPPEHSPAAPPGGVPVGGGPVPGSPVAGAPAGPGGPAVSGSAPPPAATAPPGNGGKPR